MAKARYLLTRKTGLRGGRVSFWGLALVAISALIAAPATAADEPEITSQGFEISEAQTGLIGRFDRLRVRIEAPRRIESLVVEERSYEVDLATTPDRSHFDLFGLDKRVRQHQDVTLNFANYINRKLETEGRYEFTLTVTDRDGRSANARLLVEVHEEKPVVRAPNPATLPVEQDNFMFRRVGDRSVSGAKDFALGWKTVDDIKVVIAIGILDESGTTLLRLAESDYAGIKTKGQLIEAAKNAKRLDSLELSAANNEAAGNIFAIERHDKLFVFKITSSSTSLSELGTTVTLVGEYKH